MSNYQDGSEIIRRDGDAALRDAAKAAAVSVVGCALGVALAIGAVRLFVRWMP